MNDELTIDDLVARGADFFSDSLADLGEDAQTQHITDEWFVTKCHYFSESPHLVSHSFKQIPSERLSLRIYEAYVTTAPLQLADIDHKLPQYRSLVKKAVERDPSALKLVHPDYQNEGMLRLLIEWRVKNLVAEAIATPWARRCLTPALVEDTCMRYPHYALHFEPEQLTDLALSNLLEYGSRHFSEIRDANRLDLLIRPITQGHWPRRSQKPQGLANAARLLFAARTSDEKALYIAYLMTHPIDRVVKTLRGGRGVYFLMDMYTHDEIRPHLSRCSALVKGKVLELDLGM